MPAHLGPPTGEWPAYGNGRRRALGPENTAALVHGARSARVTDPVAEAILDDLMSSEGCPEFLSRALFRYSLRGWAVAEAKVLLIERYMETLGVEKQVSAKGAQSPVIMHWKQLSEHAARLRSRNGLDPVSFAKLGKTFSSQNLDIARIIAATAESDGWDSSPDGG